MNAKRALDFANMAKRVALPEGGGLNDQTEHFMQACTIIYREQAAWRREKKILSDE